ncbi:hypothetical protein [Parapedobacter tibetensis]|uniref:hypothetical protein n=1 Tax=Parapedobacter tibetensis TaxID=2972951 RepID=UPI00214DD86D|nr:hypothetical protein [Parapedobacter tibetensis]
MSTTKNRQVANNWDRENAVALAEERAVEKALKRERAKAEQLLSKERLKAEAEKLDTARSIKEMGVLTDQHIAEKFKLPLEVVERL